MLEKGKKEREKKASIGDGGNVKQTELAERAAYVNSLCVPCDRDKGAAAKNFATVNLTFNKTLPLLLFSLLLFLNSLKMFSFLATFYF